MHAIADALLRRRNNSSLTPYEIAGWFALITTGAAVSAFGVAAFLVPANVAGPGLLGVATILNYLMDLPVGAVTLVANIPILVLGYRYLDGTKTVLGTVYYIGVFSIIVDLMIPVFGAGLTDNLVIAALFGGALNGLGGGLVYRASGTMGGTSTIARILQIKLGTPLSITSLATDVVIMIAAGMVFGWEPALAALIGLFVTGATSDYALEGPNVVCTAVIVTQYPDRLSAAIKGALDRDAIAWHSEDSQHHASREVLFVTIARPEARQLKGVVAAMDADSFVVISQGSNAWGDGFRPLVGYR